MTDSRSDWDALVYWASALYPDDLPPAERDIADSYQLMLVARTPDFVSFSEPEIWIDERRGPGRGMIDSTIAEQDGVYYRLTKDESYASPRHGTVTPITREEYRRLRDSKRRGRALTPPRSNGSRFRSGERGCSIRDGVMH